MKLKISYTTRLYLLILAAVAVMSFIFLLSFFTMQKIQQTNKKITTLYLPAIVKAEQLKNFAIYSNALLRQWLFLERDTNAQSYKELRKINRIEIYNFKSTIWDYVDQLPKKEQSKFHILIDAVDTIMVHQSTILNLFEDYKKFANISLFFESVSSLLPGGTLYEYEKIILKTADEITNILTERITNFNHEINKKIRIFKTNLTIVVILVIFGLIILAYWSISYFNREIKEINETLLNLSEGKLDYPEVRLTNDEFGKINKLIRKLIDGLRKASDFAIALSKNDFNFKFEPRSNDDVLGNALIELRKNLIQAQHEAQLRQIENIQRQWTSQGLAEFAELLREHANDLDELAKAVIAKLVDYTVADIGGLYIANDEDPNKIILELKAFYAFNEEKFKELKLELTEDKKETLIGESFVKGHTIYINNIPEDYLHHKKKDPIKIKSGLGSATPRSLLIVPLKANEQTLGVVELAAFQEFEKYQIEFVEKIGESIASAIANVKINIRTNKLLEEAAKKAAKLETELKSALLKIKKQETTIRELRISLERERAQFRKVMEERNKLENEIKKLKIEFEEKLKEKQLEINNLLLAINNTLGFYQLSPSGDFIDANALYLKFLDLTREDLIGRKHQLFVSREFISSGNYKQIWDNLKLGKTVSTTVQYMIEGKLKFVNEVYTPILNEQNELEKVLVFSFVS